MRASDLARSAFIEIRAHKVRSALTSVSLSIGVAAALYTLSQVANIGQQYRNAMQIMGPQERLVLCLPSVKLGGRPRRGDCGYDLVPKRVDHGTPRD